VSSGPSRFLKRLCAAAVIVAIVLLTRAFWLPVLAAPLIHDDGPAKADIAVVLAGDAWGRRIVKAAELVQQGFVPAVLVSGPDGHYGHYESDYAIAYAVEKGYRRDWFIAAPNSARSTQEEARVILCELRRRGVRSFLLVTSDYHTGRSVRIYRRIAREMGFEPAMRAVAAPDEHFRQASWWRDRESRKIVFFEWCKTVDALFEK
jgi:uncharacterized SAM-binding protein YcdF (DUF218 family)